MPSSRRPAEPSGQGRVTLVGAGPGATDLLTLRAVRALAAADAVLFDDLVGADVLKLIPPAAQRIRVGKRAGRESWAQADIIALMIELARAGSRVVRLKCGDPMIFGRGGEEVAALRAAGIAYAVVPGISAANAAAAALCVSLTHRDHARSVTYLTGFTKEGGVPDGVDWAALAEPTGTLAIYMAGRVAPRIARRLLLAGRPAETPVVIAEAVSHPDERTHRLRLKDLLGWRHASDRPVLLLIGDAMAEACCPDVSAATASEALRPAMTM